MSIKLSSRTSSFVMALCASVLLEVGASLIPHRSAARDETADPVSIAAPELSGGRWLNTTHPISLAARRGKVTVVHFWTFDCINCKHNLPSYDRWQHRFERQGVLIIGVHTPETPSERDEASVARQVKRLGITYPVLTDTRGSNWDRWGLNAWPTVFLIDKRGRVRYRWVGELEYMGAHGEARMGRLIDALLRE